MSRGVNSIQDAWNTVSLEERLEVVSKSQAMAFLSASLLTLVIGSVGYAIDDFNVFLVGAAASVVLLPVFNQRAWVRVQPKLILDYLAARVVTLRFANAHHIARPDILLIFRASMQELPDSSSRDPKLRKYNRAVSMFPGSKTSVWVALMKGGIVIFSEQLGGARLEYIHPTSNELAVRKPSAEETRDEQSVVVSHTGKRAKTILLSGDYPGALLVFEKQLAKLLQERKAQPRKG